MRNRGKHRLSVAVLWLLISAAVSYFVIGLGTFGLLKDVLGVDRALANRMALAAFLAATLLLAVAPLVILRSLVDVTHGSARFMSGRGVKRLTGNEGLIVGRDPATARLIRYDGEAHLITIAPTRSGKGVGAVIPNLLTYGGAVVCIDPKGENTRVTAERRRAFGPVHVLDPFGVSGLPSTAYNPLDALDAASPDLADDAALLADALVHDPPSQVSEAHWNEEAKALIAGLLMLIASDEPPEHRTLGRLRALLTLPPAGFVVLLGRMAASGAANGLVARAANRHLGKSDREAAGVLSTAQRHTHVLDSERIVAVTSRSDFSFEDLADTRATVFLVLPPDRIDSYNRWLRLMVAQALSEFARTPARPDRPVLFLLDEFACLGRLDPIARAMTMMAGYGVRLWPIVQDLHQLRGLYGTQAGTLLSNAGCVQLFNVSDIETAEWVSRMLGETTVSDRERGWLDRQGSAIFAGPRPLFLRRDTDALTSRPLLTPDEVMRLPLATMLLFLSNRPPVLAAKVRYFADIEFQGLFNAG